MADFLNWFIDPVKNQYADFEGRTGRKAFWMFILVSILISIAISIVEGIINVKVFGVLFSLAILVPNIAITTRRLHDVNKSGWWQLIMLIPVVGIIVLIVWLVGESKNEGNKFGTEVNTDPEPEVDPFVPATPQVEESVEQKY